MRVDPIEVRAVVDHPPARVWRVVGRPELYPRFIRGITWCERVDSSKKGSGARYSVRMTIDDESLFSDEVEIMIYRENEQIVWSSAGPIEHRGSVRLHDLGKNRTEIGLLLTLPPEGSPLSESLVRRRLRDALGLIDGYLAEIPANGEAMDRASASGSKLAVARTLVRAGVLAPGRPDRLVRQLSALAKWGATVVGGYQAAAGRAPDETAIVDEEGFLTFAELDERSNRLANGLSKIGVRAGKRVALMCRNHGSMVESIIACGKLGSDVLLLNTGLSATQVTEVIRRHKAMALLGDDEFAPRTRHVPSAVSWVRTWPDDHVVGTTIEELIRDAPADKLQPTTKPGRIVVLTSGTTGTPKGARRPTPKGPGSAAAVLSRIPFRAGERMLVAAPLFHTWGLAAMQLGMALRASLVLQRKFDAEATLHAIQEHRCTSLVAVPIMLQRILDLPEQVRAKYDLSSLRIVASSGSALPGSFVTAFQDTFGDVLYNLYGSTEVSWGSIANPFDLRAAPSTAGRPPLGTRVGIFDERGKPVPPGMHGRIFVGNEMLFEGYTNGTSREIRDDMMDTGDRGYLDADGRLFVSGRADEMIISGGENVFPRSVEEILAALPQVQDVAVVGVPDKEWGQRLAAYVVPRPGVWMDEDQIRAYVNQRIARYAVPRDVFFVERLPRNETGKVLKRLLENGEW
jgi:acyl-CoA synthetase (AMP-forming)/AMP-acid ligase II